MSLDATGVPQQGPGGAADDGRMATVAMVYNPVPEDHERWAKPSGARPPWQARYLASLRGQAGLGEPLRRQAAQVGMDRRRAVDRALRRRVGAGGLAGDELRPGRGGDPRLLPRLGVPRGPGQGAAGAGTEAAQACHRRVVPPAEARGGPGGAGRAAGPGPAAAAVGPRGVARRR